MLTPEEIIEEAQAAAIAKIFELADKGNRTSAIQAAIELGYNQVVDELQGITGQDPDWYNI